MGVDTREMRFRPQPHAQTRRQDWPHWIQTQCTRTPRTNENRTSRTILSQVACAPSRATQHGEIADDIISVLLTDHY